MGRTIPLFGAVSALLGVVLVLFVLPAGAQDVGGIPPGTAANGVDTDNNNSPPDVVVVAASGCVVAAGASITLEDGDGTRAIFTDGARGITILAQDGHPRIEGPPGDFVGDHARFPTSDESFDTDGDYSVVSSTGVTGCTGGGGGGSASPVDDQYGPGNVKNPGDVVPKTSSTKKMPNTGGPPYLAVGALLLLCVALLAGRGALRP
jgi:hypothetical protein